MKSSSQNTEIIKVGSRLSNHMLSNSSVSMEDEKPQDINNNSNKDLAISSEQNFFLDEFKKLLTLSVNNDNKRLKLFNFIAISIMCFSCMITAFNGVKDYLKFDVVTQTRGK